MTKSNNSVGYIVMPMDLTDRQTIIYIQLYKRCNFQDMTVKYTIDQLIADITLVDLTYKQVYNDIQKMIKEGYLQVVKKASKGNAPVYKIVTMIEINNINQEEKGGIPKDTKRIPKHSNFNGSEGEEGNQRIPKGYPIKEKEKEIDRYIKENISIYQSIIFLYFSLVKNDKNIKAETLTIDTIKGCLEGKGISIIKDYIENSNVSLIEDGIRNYSNMINDKEFKKHNDYYSRNIMTLSLLITNITKYFKTGAAYQEYESFKNAAATKTTERIRKVNKVIDPYDY